jgi:flagellar basal-body rod protein FlgC
MPYKNISSISKSMHIAASGMKAQSDRLQVIAQNIANAASVGNTPGEEPYRRKTITFQNVMDREMGVERVKTKSIDVDRSPYIKRFEPTHPAADEEGYILTPNVNSMIEMVDMKEARRAYEANVNVIEMSKGMLQQTIGLLR